jgi:wyosine [tRNA(Phe)-imidazoG37] synthetase (radical SAM superfamily)
MSAAGLQPEPNCELSSGQFLTFVVPANGCNLNCSFCIIRQRREITETHLTPDDLVRFVREAVEHAPTFALAIQGYEPLLAESLPFTQAILGTGRFLGIPTSLVTNGTKLADAVDLLTTLAPSKIAVSLDAASAHIHDRIRGAAGAWAAAVGGIRSAIDALAPRTRVVVSSVLLPSRRHYLDGMPALLRSIGVDRWIINPLLRVGRNQAGGPVAGQVSLFRDLLALQEAARRDGISLTVDDEFSHLRYDAACVSEPSLRALHVRTLPPNVEIFRLTPSGQCSVGDHILKQVAPDTPRWVPGNVHAGKFLEMLSRQTQAAHRQIA